MNNVVHRGSEFGLPTAQVKHTADDFQNFFDSKVQQIRSATSGPATATVGGLCSDQVGLALSGSSQRPVLMIWYKVTTDEVCQTVMAAPVKSSSLNPTPTFLPRECIDSILLYLTTMVNVSLWEGCLPMAVVTLLSLDPQNLKNYRPVSNLTFVSKPVERVAVICHWPPTVPELHCQFNKNLQSTQYKQTRILHV